MRRNMFRNVCRRIFKGSLFLRLIGCIVLLGVSANILCLAVPVQAASVVVHQTQLNRNSDAPIAANFYLPTSVLRPLFQDRIDQQVPVVVNGAITGIVANLPPSSQGWAKQMAQTLIQPSARLTALSPQEGGLATTLQVSLYPGDPKPINASMLVTFGVKDATTIQVSAQAIKDAPALVSGPLATFHLPIGSLNTVHTMAACGDAALAIGMQFPLALGQGQSTTLAPVHTSGMQMARNVSAAGSVAYVEIPASSLATLGPDFGTIQLSNNLSAKNLQVAVQGSQLVVTSDIQLGSLRVGQAITTITPTANNGNLAVTVNKTTLSVLLMQFQYNTYNQQIEQLINSKLSGALAGKFTVNTAAIGADSHVPCAAADSLILSGTTGLL